MIGLIFSAGIGSRLKPWTDLHPKALVPVGNKPMLQRVIENMVAIGINEIIVNVHHFPDQIIEFLDANNNFGINLHISDESHQLLDTGGAILRVASRLLPHDHILIHNADIFTDIDLSMIVKHHLLSNADATLLTSCRKSSRQLVFDHQQRLKGWINNTSDKRIPDTMQIDPDNDSLRSFNGIHVITPSIVKWLLHHPLQGSFPIIPQYIAMSQELSINSFTPDSDYTWVDIGRPDSLKLAQTIASSHRK